MHLEFINETCDTEYIIHKLNTRRNVGYNIEIVAHTIQEQKKILSCITCGLIKYGGKYKVVDSKVIVGKAVANIIFKEIKIIKERKNYAELSNVTRENFKRLGIEIR